MGLQALPSSPLNLSGVGDSCRTKAMVRYEVLLLDIGGRVILPIAYGIEDIMFPLEGGQPGVHEGSVPGGTNRWAAGEVSLLMGQDNLSLFPSEKRRVGDAALYGSRFGTGFIALGRPP
jgi:hypothetical protein